MSKPTKELQFNRNDWSDDSGDEILGSINKIKRREIFSFKVTTDDAGEPVINIAPSDIRHEGNSSIKGKSDGDHVNAYVLLLQSIACCKGKKIKELPETFYQAIVSILPEEVVFFKKEKELLKKELIDMREIRKEATSQLRKLSPSIIEQTKSSLLLSEFELIARHIETVGNEFVKKANINQNAAFDKSRKLDSTIPYTKKNAGCEVDSLAKLNSFNQNFGYFFDNSETEVEYGTIYTGKRAIKHALSNIFSLKDSDINKIKEEFIDFCNNIKDNFKVPPASPLQKKTIRALSKLADASADLFDYTATGKPNNDSWDTLYYTLSKHNKLIFNSFPNLQKLPLVCKNIIREKIVDNILSNQGWDKLAIKEEGWSNDDFLERKWVLEKIDKIELEQTEELKRKENEFDSNPTPQTKIRLREQIIKNLANKAVSSTSI